MKPLAALRQSLAFPTILIVNSICFHSNAATIKQLLATDNVAYVELLPEEQTANPHFLLATHEGKQCRLPIVLQKEKLAKVSTKSCPFKEQLSIGNTLEMPLMNEEIADNKPEVAAAPSPVKEVKPIQPESSESAIKRDITDLAFLPYEGRSLFQFSAFQQKIDGDISLGNSNFSNNSVKTQALDFLYVYGATDRFSIYVSDEVVLSTDDDVHYGPGAGSLNGQSKTHTNDGSVDPVIGFNYRLLEQSEKKSVNIDFRAGYLTKLQDAKGDTSTQKGNSARGGDGSEIGLSLSKQFDANSFKVSFLQTNYNKRTSTADSIKTETTGGNTTVAEVATQVKFKDNFFGDVILDYTSIGSEEMTDTTTIKADSYSYATVGLAFKLVLVPDSVYLNFAGSRDNSYTQTATVGTAKLAANVAAATKFSVGLNVGF